MTWRVCPAFATRLSARHCIPFPAHWNAPRTMNCCVVVVVDNVTVRLANPLESWTQPNRRHTKTVPDSPQRPAPCERKRRRGGCVRAMVPQGHDTTRHQGAPCPPTAEHRNTHLVLGLDQGVQASLHQSLPPNPVRQRSRELAACRVTEENHVTRSARTKQKCRTALTCRQKDRSQRSGAR
jgi:hypothetical protein